VRIISRRPARKKSKTAVTAASAGREHVQRPTPDLHKVCKKVAQKAHKKETPPARAPALHMQRIQLFKCTREQIRNNHTGASPTPPPLPGEHLDWVCKQCNAHVWCMQMRSHLASRQSHTELRGHAESERGAAAESGVFSALLLLLGNVCASVRRGREY
jgi:hypothetical protein